MFQHSISSCHLNTGNVAGSGPPRRLAWRACGIGPRKRRRLYQQIRRVISKSTTSARHNAQRGRFWGDNVLPSRIWWQEGPSQPWSFVSGTMSCTAIKKLMKNSASTAMKSEKAPQSHLSGGSYVCDTQLWSCSWKIVSQVAERLVPGHEHHQRDRTPRVFGQAPALEPFRFGRPGDEINKGSWSIEEVKLFMSCAGLFLE